MRIINGTDDFSCFLSHRQKTSEIMSDANGLFEKRLCPDEFAQRVVKEVAGKGDKAVFEISEALDGCVMEFLEVPKSDIDRSFSVVPKHVTEALKKAAVRIRSFQENIMPRSWMDISGELGEKVVPVNSVGAYVPGGSASLVLSALMCVIPAKTAGVQNVFISSPAKGGELPNPAIMVAAAIAGADRIFKIGGAQAVAAFALGTETVPKTDIVCGPGNVFVTAAKRAVVGEVGIDGLYGPTETLIIADDSANAAWTAADMLAQAEHDTLACPILVSLSPKFSESVATEIKSQLTNFSRRTTAQTAIETNGAIINVKSFKEAVQVANKWAPEHLSIMIKNPELIDYTHFVAGGLFIGEYSPEVVGDYIAGPSHVMPTGGTARFNSALNVRTFLRFMPVVKLSQKSFLELEADIETLAYLEGLEGHARAARFRIGNGDLNT